MVAQVFFASNATIVHVLHYLNCPFPTQCVAICGRQIMFHFVAFYQVKIRTQIDGATKPIMLSFFTHEKLIAAAVIARSKATTYCNAF
jgi:hypothetical protein